MNKVVINTSPLIVLFKTQFADLLPELFTEIIVPSGVWDEIVAAGKTDISSRQLPTTSWANQTLVSQIPASILAWGLDRGESEVLTAEGGHRRHPNLIRVYR